MTTPKPKAPKATPNTARLDQELTELVGSHLKDVALAQAEAIEQLIRAFNLEPENVVSIEANPKAGRVRVLTSDNAYRTLKFEVAE